MTGTTSQGLRGERVMKNKEGRTMELGEMVRVGVTAGIPVAIVSAVIILLRAGNIAAVGQANANTVGFGSGGLVTWIGTWAAVSLVFGVVATWAYGFLSGKFGWGLPQYLGLALALAAGLTVLAYMRLYGGEAHPFATEWLGLNFAFGAGFGYLIPTLVG